MVAPAELQSAAARRDDHAVDAVDEPRSAPPSGAAISIDAGGRDDGRSPSGVALLSHALDTSAMNNAMSVVVIRGRAMSASRERGTVPITTDAIHGFA